MEAIYLPNAQSLLDLFNAKIDHNLPDPNTYLQPTYTLVTVKETNASFIDLDSPINDLSFTHFDRTFYRKKRLGYEGKSISVWEKL